MSEYSELIKRFDKIRDYMRDFYVYGFMSRKDFKQKKSLRSYDNEKRRIESYLSEYMSFQVDDIGKKVFLSVDSSNIAENPLYRAFKAKSFTKNDITLHFMILDILQETNGLSATEISDRIAREYLWYFEAPVILDVSTVRNKLTEYVACGILVGKKQGRKLLYFLNDTQIPLSNYSDAIMLYSEISPLGVIGSYILDQCNYDSHLVSYKHHYIMHALESEIVYELLKAIRNEQKVEILNHNIRAQESIMLEIVPLQFMISVQGGRRYLAAYSYRSKAILPFRLDYIKSVKCIDHCKEITVYKKQLHEILPNTWGASFGRGRNLEHLTMRLEIRPEEGFLIDRILREGRNGILTRIDEFIYQYDISVYDALEMLPWLRTFIGKIISLECTNKAVVRTFYKDLDALYAIYGGESTDIS